VKKSVARVDGLGAKHLKAALTQAKQGIKG